MDDSLDIEEQYLTFYRRLFADDLESLLLPEYEHTPYSSETYWFNQGLRYAIMILRHS